MGIDHPPAGLYPTGWQGWSRQWDGSIWLGPALEAPDAPALSTRHRVVDVLRAPALWVLVGGLVLGAAIGVFGASIPALLAVGGLIAAAGPAVAFVLILRRRLGIPALAVRGVYIWGIAAGVVAAALAWVIEQPLPGEAGLALTGPIEEGAKLLIPFVLLLVGVRGYRDPRVGIYLVAIVGAVFGVLEGAEYVLFSQELGGANPFLTRPWIELLHIFATAGAAALIWRAAHRKGRGFTLVGLGAFLVAAALHSFNDGVLGLTSGLLANLVLVLVALVYFFWYRWFVRGSVSPTMVSAVPASWRARLPRTS